MGSTETAQVGPIADLAVSLQVTEICAHLGRSFFVLFYALPHQNPPRALHNLATLSICAAPPFAHDWKTSENHGAALKQRAVSAICGTRVGFGRVVLSQLTLECSKMHAPVVAVAVVVVLRKEAAYYFYYYLGTHCYVYGSTLRGARSK